MREPRQADPELSTASVDNPVQDRCFGFATGWGQWQFRWIGRLLTSGIEGHGQWPNRAQTHHQVSAAPIAAPASAETPVTAAQRQAG